MPTINAGATLTTTIAAGSRFGMGRGTGTYRVGPVGSSSRPTIEELIDPEGTWLGPYEADCSLFVRASTAVTYNIIPAFDALTQSPVIADSSGALSAGGSAVSEDGNSTSARSITSFAMPSGSINADARGSDANSTPNVVTSVTDLNTLMPYRVVQRCGSFRLKYTNGSGVANVAAVRIKATVEVPVKNGAGRTILPVTFNNGQDTADMPAGSGRALYSDWIDYPLAIDDLVHVKNWYVAPGGGAFNIIMFGNLGSTGVNNPTDAFNSARLNLGADSTGVLAGTGTWTSANFQAGFTEAGIEGRNFPAGRKKSVDLWTDSIVAGTATTWLLRVLKANKIPFLGLGLSGSNQSTIPSTAAARMKIACGDIAVCAHGHNNLAGTAALANLWSVLRMMGYSKIIQVMVTEDFTSTDGFATTVNQTRTTDATAMNAFINANKGVGDGPDVVWDLPSIMQPGRVWPALWTTDGIHPIAAGEAGAAAAVPASWVADLTS